MGQLRFGLIGMSSIMINRLAVRSRPGSCRAYDLTERKNFMPPEENLVRVGLANG